MGTSFLVKLGNEAMNCLAQQLHYNSHVLLFIIPANVSTYIPHKVKIHYMIGRHNASVAVHLFNYLLCVVTSYLKRSYCSVCDINYRAR